MARFKRVNNRHVALLQSTDLTNGKVESVKLPRGQTYRELIIRVHGRINVTTLGSPVVREDAPFTAIRYIEIIRGGSKLLGRLRGISLRRVKEAEAGTPPEVTVPTIGTGNNDFYADLSYVFGPEDAADRDLYALHTRGVGSVELFVSFGTQSDFFSTAPTASTLTVLEAQIELVQYAEGFKFPAGGPLLRKLIENVETPAASQSELPLPTQGIPAGPLLDRIFVMARDGATLLRSDTFVTRFKLRYAGSATQNRTWAGWKTENKREGQQETQPAGFAWMTFDYDRDLLGMLPTKDTDDISLLVDTGTSGGGTPEVAIIRSEIEAQLPEGFVIR